MPCCALPLFVSKNAERFNWNSNYSGVRCTDLSSSETFKKKYLFIKMKSWIHYMPQLYAVQLLRARKYRKLQCNIIKSRNRTEMKLSLPFRFVTHANNEVTSAIVKRSEEENRHWKAGENDFGTQYIIHKTYLSKRTSFKNIPLKSEQKTKWNAGDICGIFQCMKSFTQWTLNDTKRTMAWKTSSSKAVQKFTTHTLSSQHTSYFIANSWIATAFFALGLHHTLSFFFFVHYELFVVFLSP